MADAQEEVFLRKGISLFFLPLFFLLCKVVLIVGTLDINESKDRERPELSLVEIKKH